MNTAGSRPVLHLCLSSRHLAIRPSPLRCSSATYTPPSAVQQNSTPNSAPPRFTPRRSASETHRVQSRQEKLPNRTKAPPEEVRKFLKQRSTIIPETIAPQLSQAEVSDIFSQELFVFRCDVTATQIPAAMSSYKQLVEVGALAADDISNLARQIHARYRLDQDKERILPYLRQLIDNLRDQSIPGHPLASVHILSCLKDMEEYALCNEFWLWVHGKDENFCDARTYGAAIECLAYQGTPLENMESLWREAFERYSTTTMPSVAISTGRGVPLMLLQGIITGRLFHGSWRAAYEGFDICTRLYPTLTPARIYELFIYERPAREAYIIFLMACRAGTPPKPGVLTPLLKEIWLKTCDVRAMIRLVYSFVGAGGKPNAMHLNSLIGGILGSFPRNLSPGSAEYEPLYQGTMALVRSLIKAFDHMGTPLNAASFNTIISLGGKLRRPELVHSGLQELLDAGLKPTMVTYRTLLNAVGNVGEPTLLEDSWKMLNAARIENRLDWEFRDWRALANATSATNRSDYFYSQLEQYKGTLPRNFYRNILGVMQQMINGNSPSMSKSKPAPGPESPVPTPQELLFKEVRMLSEIFSSGRIHDFADSTLFNLLPSDRAPEGVTLSEHQEQELRQIYDRLSIPISIIDIENAAAKGSTKTSTGYDVERLRWENWKAVNRLLFEAECAERQEQERGVRASREATTGVVVKEPKPKPRNIGYEFLFLNEDRAKKQIRQEVEEVAKRQQVRAKGWKVQEMSVRTKLGAVSNEGDEV